MLGCMDVLVYIITYECIYAIHRLLYYPVIREFVYLRFYYFSGMR